MVFLNYEWGRTLEFFLTFFYLKILMYAFVLGKWGKLCNQYAFEVIRNLLNILYHKKIVFLYHAKDWMPRSMNILNSYVYSPFRWMFVKFDCLATM